MGTDLIVQILIENAPGWVDEAATPEQAAQVRRSLGLAGASPVVLYTGTFEAYQGLDLLFDAMAIVGRARPDARLVLAGGRPEQVTRARELARAAGIEAITLFAGERQAGEIPAYLLAADVLVSPRSRGTNTPLKIYQYMRSGKPIVATRLLTHTQVLSDQTAILTGVPPREFADGILAVSLVFYLRAEAGASLSETHHRRRRCACARVAYAILSPGARATAVLLRRGLAVRVSGGEPDRRRTARGGLAADSARGAVQAQRAPLVAL